jgi:heat shock protein HslJ
MALSLAACSPAALLAILPVSRETSGQEAPVVEVVEPAVESPEEGAAGGLGDAPMTLPALFGPVWSWVRTDSPDGELLVEGPERYTLQLLEDGTYNARLDCNTMSGAYTLEEGKLRLEPGAMTLMMCAEGSQSDAFLNQLLAAVALSYDEAGVHIELAENAGTMHLVFNDVATAEDLIVTPALEDLLGVEWWWMGTTTAETEMGLPLSGDYTLVFNADGTFSARADCNQVNGTYTLDGGSLQITPAAMTRALCAEGSLSEEFVRQLSAAAIVFMTGSDLHIDMIYDSGTLHFHPAE